MTVLLLTDLEGISGVSDISMIMDEDGEGYRFACNRLASDTNAAIRGCFDGGADQVFVVDGHGSANNLDASKLDPRAEQITIQQWIDYTRSGKVDVFMEVGAHAKPGTLNAFLDHVQSSIKWFEYTINGTSYGELTQGGLFMGAFGVPFVMVSGDVKACDEAKSLLPQVECAVVKTGIGRNHADCLPQEESEARIYEAAKRGMALHGKAAPMTLPMPLTIELVHTRSDYCDDTMKTHPEFTRLDARTARRVVEKIESYSDLLFW